MNKFVQFLVALCSFVWLIIGVGVLAGGIIFGVFIARTKPFEQIQQFAPLLMGSGMGEQSVIPFQSGSGTKVSIPTQGQSIEQLIANPEFQACAIRVLGEARVATLINQKQLPSTSEMVRLSACISPQK